MNAGLESFDVSGTRRLWSLWDMLNFMASDFHRAAGTIQSIRGHINGVMAFASRAKSDQLRLEQVVQETRDLIVRRLTRLENVSVGLSIPVTMDAVRLLKKHIDVEKRPITYEELRNKLSDIHDRMVSELKSVMMLILESEMARFYEPSEPLFGRQVNDQFPSLIDEIAEAGKCYALDRGTASAFHSIRCLEAGIRALSRCLGIPDPTKGADRSWPKLLRVISDEVELRWPAKTGRMHGDAKLLDEAYGALSGMQNPYRNSTMHFDQKYTPEEAKHIMEMVKGFMTKLASRMDENGQPLA